MKKLYDEKDPLDCNDPDSLDVDLCDCQGICICEPGLEIDKDDEICDNCCCNEDDENSEEIDVHVAFQDEDTSI